MADETSRREEAAAAAAVVQQAAREPTARAALAPNTDERLFMLREIAALKAEQKRAREAKKAVAAQPREGDGEAHTCRCSRRGGPRRFRYRSRGDAYRRWHKRGIERLAITGKEQGKEQLNQHREEFATAWRDPADLEESFVHTRRIESV